MGYIIRYCNPWIPASRFPQLRGSVCPATMLPTNEAQYHEALEQVASQGREVYDSGNVETDYHYDPFTWNIIPNGYHAEPPSLPWTDGLTPQQFWALVPDGKTRKDVGA